MNFGEKLKALRNNKDISQAKVSKGISLLSDIQISQSYLSALELRPDAPKPRITRLFAQYYDVPVSYLDNKLNDISEDDIQRRLEHAGEWIENKRLIS